MTPSTTSSPAPVPEDPGRRPSDLAGLLDLGFVAFYGFGAYFYAIVASDQLPAHWPTWIAIPVIWRAIRKYILERGQAPPPE